MSNVTRIKARDAHSLQGLKHHMAVDKPDGGLLLTKVGDSWEWRFYGDITVVEMVGGMEMVKHDFLTMDRELAE